MFNFDIPSLEWRDAFIPKKSGGKRHISIPNDELKALQRDILHELEGMEELRPSAFAHGFVKHRSTGTGALMQNRNADVILCYDIKDFFDNFPEKPVRDRLLAAGLGEGLTDKILKVCTKDGHFPQGSPCSPFLTNVGMFETDLVIAAFAKKYGLLYTRYADDITFSKAVNSPYRTRKRYGVVTTGLDKILQSRLGLRLKASKTHSIWLNGSERRRITGIVIRKDGNGFNAPKEMRRKARGILHRLYSRVVVDNHGVVQDGDWHDWLYVNGLITYSNGIRRLSYRGTVVEDALRDNPGMRLEDMRGDDPIVAASSFDPFISIEKYSALKALFAKEN